MRRHMDNLDRLAKKLQARYGENDPLVLQVREELAAWALRYASFHGGAFAAREPRMRHEKKSSPSHAQP